ncbi:YjjG family noncanonical pyrimidine nucleotidase [Faecalibacterium prausnitzii]|uniref:YjjG family noncanonical pyrimidine nucleotidase n=1 Tax=Faecalibacterium prausnitzii TaxID=853 RepID=UPI003C30D3B7
MAKYYCVLFDADNTLLNFDAAESKALAETLVNYGIEPDAETVQTYRTINSELWRQLEKGQIKREKLMAERFTRFLKAVNAAGSGAEMNQYYLDQLSTHPDLAAPNVLDVMKELAEVATLAVVTNGFDRVQSRRVAESGLKEFVEEVFVSEKLDSEKPNRKIFDTALRSLGVENREHVLVVGDGLSSDIQGGVNAGLDTCWYNPSHAENPGKVVPTYEIADLKELYPLVMEQEELANVGLKNRRHQL